MHSRRRKEMGLMSHKENFPPFGWGWWCFWLRLNTYSSLLIPHPTTDPAALYSHLLIFMSPSIIFLCALLEIRKISAARDQTHSQTCRRHPSLKKWLLSARQRLAVHTFQLMCFSVHVDCYCPFIRNILLLIA